MRRQTATERLDDRRQINNDLQMRKYHLTTVEDLLSLDELGDDLRNLRADLKEGWLLVAVEDRFRIGTHIFKLPADELDNLKHYAARRFSGYTAYGNMPADPETALGPQGVRLRHNIFIGPKRIRLSGKMITVKYDAK